MDDAKAPAASFPVHSKQRGQRTCAVGKRVIPQSAQLPGSTADTAAAQAGSSGLSFSGDSPSAAGASEAGGDLWIPSRPREQRILSTTRPQGRALRGRGAERSRTLSQSTAANLTDTEQNRELGKRERGVGIRRGKIVLPESPED